MPSISTTSDLLIYIVSLIVGLTFHEAMHAFTARWLGDTTAEDVGRLTLNPLRHIDPFTTILLPIVSILIFHVPFLAAKPVPFNPNRVKWGEMGAALVGIAGPITNFVLALLAALFIKIAQVPFYSNTYHALSLFMYINIAVFVFNMIPFPPLDGSRLLYAFAPEGLQEVMSRIESMGFSAILIFMVLVLLFFGSFILNIDNSIYSFLIR